MTSNIGGGLKFYDTFIQNTFFCMEVLLQKGVYKSSDVTYERPFLYHNFSTTRIKGKKIVLNFMH